MAKGKKSNRKPRGLLGRRGRPRKTGICEKCGEDALYCTGSHLRGHVRNRVYKCKACGHKTSRVSSLCPAGQEFQALKGYPAEISVREICS